MPRQTGTRTTAKAKRVALLRDRFRAAHSKGMEALRRHDYDGFGDAIAEEARILEAQAGLLQEQQRIAAEFARRISAHLRLGVP